MQEEEKLRLLGVEFELAEQPCLQAIFSPNDQQLIVALKCGGLQVFKIKENIVNTIQTIEYDSNGNIQIYLLSF